MTATAQKRKAAPVKDPMAMEIGGRIRQAREMAGMKTMQALVEKIPEWGISRLSNYENGWSVAYPGDLQKIARATGTSECWLQFGVGPIRSDQRDLQAIRHQNFRVVVTMAKEAGQLKSLVKALGVSPKKIEDYVSDPTFILSVRLVRRCEKFHVKPTGWMDEQHIEHDPVCQAFPLQLRDLMTIYSELDPVRRRDLVNYARSLAS
jgi:transcriptional regulator with XRE-family HTH domain